MMDSAEKAIYEEQLQLLQGQLIESMIRNQNLESDLKNLKEKESVTKLYAEIAEQKSTIQSLKQLLAVRIKGRAKGVKYKIHSGDSDHAGSGTDGSFSEKDGADSPQLPHQHKPEVTSRTASMRFVDDDWNYMDLHDTDTADDVDVATEVHNDDDILQHSHSPHSLANTSAGGALTYWQRLRVWLYQIWFGIITNVSELTQGIADPTSIAGVTNNGDELSVKTLKDNISRLRHDSKPIFEYIKQVNSLLSWVSPPHTIISFMMYMYFVWRGWLLSASLFYCIMQLTLTYINKLAYVPKKRVDDVSSDSDEEGDKQKEGDDADEEVDVDDNDAGGGDSHSKSSREKYSHKLHLVIQVARRVQNMLGLVADNLEKWHNLIHWQSTEITQYLYIRLCIFFVITLVVPNNILFTILGFFLGVKLFIVNNIYSRIPHVKEKYDTTAKLWQQLPTNADLEKYYTIDKFILPDNPLELQTEDKLTKSQLSYNNQRFCELFDLPATEHPLSSWRGGRRAAVIDKDKSWFSAVKYGKLYLTRSFLCFERTKDKDETLKNILIPLADIVRLKKAKPYSWFPGEGMALEIFLNNTDKPYIFGGILHRDAVYESIMRVGTQWNLSWAHSVDVLESSTSETFCAAKEQPQKDKATKKLQ